MLLLVADCWFLVFLFWFLASGFWFRCLVLTPSNIWLATSLGNMVILQFSSAVAALIQEYLLFTISSIFDLTILNVNVTNKFYEYCTSIFSKEWMDIFKDEPLKGYLPCISLEIFLLKNPLCSCFCKSKYKLNNHNFICSRIAHHASSLSIHSLIYTLLFKSSKNPCERDY